MHINGSPPHSFYEPHPDELVQMHPDAPPGDAAAPPHIQPAPEGGGASFLPGGLDMARYASSGRRNEYCSAYTNHSPEAQSQIQAAHEQLLAEGYVFVGYHGTAVSKVENIVSDGLDSGRSMLDPAKPWGASVYTSPQPETAAGYAFDNPPVREDGTSDPSLEGSVAGTLLRVYMKREDFERLHRPVDNMASPDLQPRADADYIYTGPVDGSDSNAGVIETAFSASASAGLVAIPSEYGIDNSNGTKPVLQGQPITDPPPLSMDDAANDNWWAVPGSGNHHLLQPPQPIQVGDDEPFTTSPSSPVGPVDPTSRRHPSGYVTPQTDLQAKKDHGDVASAAMAASKVYETPPPGQANTFTVDGATWREVSDPEAELGIDMTPDTGLGTTSLVGNPLKTSIFKKDGEPPEYIVAFKGTTPLDGRDWIANIGQGAGLPSAVYQRAAAIALQVANSDKPGLSNATFAGHSLGGGLATQANILTGNATYAFNPADLSRDTISWARQQALDRSPYHDIPATWQDWGGVRGVAATSMNPSSGLTTIVAEGDVLDKGLNRGAGGITGYNDLGDKFIVKTDPEVVDKRTGISQHDMGNVINGISNQYGLPTYEGQVVPNWGPPTVPYNEGPPAQTDP